MSKTPQWQKLGHTHMKDTFKRHTSCFSGADWRKAFLIGTCSKTFLKDVFQGW